MALSSFDDDEGYDAFSDPLVRKALEDMEAVAARLGLHAFRGPDVHPMALGYTSPDGSVSIQPQGHIVTVDFLIGDRAWSDEVQNPERAKMDQQLAPMEDDVDQDVKERMVEMRRRLGGDH